MLFFILPFSSTSQSLSKYFKNLIYDVLNNFPFKSVTLRFEKTAIYKGRGSNNVLGNVVPSIVIYCELDITATFP